MIKQHLSEELLQRYAMEGISLDGADLLHLQQCTACQQLAETYQLVQTGLVHLAQPSLDMDLAAAVMAQLPASKPTSEKALAVVLVLVVLALAACIGISIQLDFSFLQSGTGPIVSGLIGLTAVGCLVFMLVSSWQDFHHKINQLNKGNLQPSNGAAV